MKALILNSGIGTRMGELTACQPKCMTSISSRETILSRQLRQIAGAGIREVVVTTGPFEQELITYCNGLGLPLSFTFIKNEEYQHTNYIYSIFLAREYLQDELILLHGDLVMEDEVFRRIVESGQSCMAVSSTSALPEKDFKAVLRGGKIIQVGVECFNRAVAAQPAYHLMKRDWKVWLEEIERFCQDGTVTCYAENALSCLNCERTRGRGIFGTFLQWAQWATAVLLRWESRCSGRIFECGVWMETERP